MRHRELWSLFCRQAGVISLEQAATLGLNKRQVGWLIETGEWHKVLPGVYRLASIPPTPEGTIRAGGMWLAPAAVSTGLGAAWWWELTAQTPIRWEFATLSPTHLKPQRDVKVVRAFVDPFDRTSARGLPVVSKPLAALRGAVMLEKQRQGSGIAMIDRGKQRGLLSDGDLGCAFRRNRGTWGTVAMRAILEHVGGRAASEFERRAVRLLRAAGITGFQVNFRTRLATGRPVEFDIAFPELMLAIELDGYAFHSTSDQLQADLCRQREVMDDGWTVRRFTWTDVVGYPEAFIRSVRALLP